MPYKPPWYHRGRIFGTIGLPELLFFGFLLACLILAILWPSSKKDCYNDVIDGRVVRICEEVYQDGR